jgi:glycosyltransferase involved in cell wall biosynthesis
MRSRLNLPPDRVRVIYDGINLDGYEPVQDSKFKVQSPANPTLGYFARMCREKGLDTLVEAFILLKERNRVKNLKLKVGGGCGPSDLPLVEALRDRLKAKVFLDDVSFHPNVDRAGKLAFLRSLSVFSVPALYGEAFGLYVVEAMASGVPVVQPRHAAFPELVEVSGGGVICEPGDPKALADALEPLLLNPDFARALGEAGRKSVLERFNAAEMAKRTALAFEEIALNGAAPSRSSVEFSIAAAQAKS